MRLNKKVLINMELNPENINSNKKGNRDAYI